MKILHIIPSLERGGAERICLDICNELVRIGHQVVIVILEDLNHYPELSDQLVIKFIPVRYNPHLMKKDLMELGELQKFTDLFQPDIIHSHLYAADLIALHLKSKAKYLSHIHSKRKELTLPQKQFTLKQQLINYIERKKYNRLLKTNKAHSIAISNDCAQYAVARLGQPQKQVHLLHNCIDFKKFKAAPRKLQNPIQLISVGTFNANKSQDFLIQVMEQISKKKIDAHLTLVGQGPILKNCKKLVLDLNLDDKITFEGQLKHPETKLAASHIFIHAAQSEAFGLALVEAMAASLPVISTDGLGNRDIIKEGENGYMIWNRDPIEFADKISQLINNQQLYDNLAKSAYFYASKFDVVSYCEKLELIYKKTE